MKSSSSDWDGDGVDDYSTTYTYQYDDAGNVIYESYEQDYDGDGFVDDSYSYAYEYDLDGNLIYESSSSDWDNDGVFDSTTAYSFDADGNITSQYSEGWGGISQTDYDEEGKNSSSEFFF